jgi:hypothetical protein
VTDAYKKVEFSELFMGRVLNNQEYTFLIKKLDISGVLHASPD